MINGWRYQKQCQMNEQFHIFESELSKSDPASGGSRVNPEAAGFLAPITTWNPVPCPPADLYMCSCVHTHAHTHPHTPSMWQQTSQEQSATTVGITFTCCIQVSGAVFLTPCFWTACAQILGVCLKETRLIWNLCLIFPRIVTPVSFYPWNLTSVCSTFLPSWLLTL